MKYILKEYFGVGDKSGAAAVVPLIFGVGFAALAASFTVPAFIVGLAYLAGTLLGSYLAPPSLPNMGLAGIGTPEEVSGGSGGITGGQSMNPVATGELSNTASSGSVVPVIYGTRKIAGNYIYFAEFEPHHFEEWSEQPEEVQWRNMIGTDNQTAIAFWSDNGFDAEFDYFGATFRFESGVAYAHQEATGRAELGNNNIAASFQQKLVIPGARFKTADFYTYTATWALSFCRGPVDKLRKIYRNGREIAAPELTPVDPNIGTVVDIPAERDDRQKLDATQGLFHWGAAEQVVDAAFQTSVGENIPTFRNDCYMYFDKQTIGLSTTVPLMGVEVSVFPKSLTGDTTLSEIGLEANPVYCILDLLLNTDYGLGITASQIDGTTFDEAAAFVFARERGYSNVLNSIRPAIEWIDDILNEAQATLYYEDGKYKIRAYEDLDDIDEDKLLTIIWQDVLTGSLEFSRQAWDDMYDRVVLTFVERERDYARSTYKAFNSAGEHVSPFIRTYATAQPGLCTTQRAGKVAFDLLRRVSYPIATISFDTTRKFSFLRVGDLIKFSYEPYLFVGIFRVADVAESDIDDNQIKLTLTQEPVPFRITAEWDPDADFAAPILYLFPDIIDFPCVVEMPEWLTTAPSFAFFAGSTNVNLDGFDVYASVEGVTYTKVGQHNKVHAGGKVIDSYPLQYSEAAAAGAPNCSFNVDDLSGITVSAFSLTPPIESLKRTRDELFRYDQLGYNCDNREWVSFNNFAQQAGLTATALSVIRTVGGGDPKLWNDGELVFFGNPHIIPIEGVSNALGVGGAGFTTVAFKLLPRSTFNIGTLADATAITLSLTQVYNTPLPASNLHIPVPAAVGYTVPGTTNFYVAGTDITFAWRPAFNDAGGAGHWQPTLTLPGVTQFTTVPDVEIRIFDTTGLTLLRTITSTPPPISQLYPFSLNEIDHGLGGGDGFRVSIAQITGLTTNLHRSIFRDFIINKLP